MSRVYKQLHKRNGVKVNDVAAQFRADFAAGLTYWDTDPAPAINGIKGMAGAAAAAAAAAGGAGNPRSGALAPNPQAAIQLLQKGLGGLLGGGGDGDGQVGGGRYGAVPLGGARDG